MAKHIGDGLCTRNTGWWWCFCWKSCIAKRAMPLILQREWLQNGNIEKERERKKKKQAHCVLQWLVSYQWDIYSVEFLARSPDFHWRRFRHAINFHSHCTFRLWFFRCMYGFFSWFLLLLLVFHSNTHPSNSSRNVVECAMYGLVAHLVRRDFDCEHLQWYVDKKKLVCT